MITGRGLGRDTDILGAIVADGLGRQPLDAGELVVTPEGIASAEAFGLPAVDGGFVWLSGGGGWLPATKAKPARLKRDRTQTIVATGVESEEAAGQPQVLLGRIIAARGVAKPSGVGKPKALQSKIVRAQTVALVGGFGSPTIMRSPIISAIGIASAELASSPVAELDFSDELAVIMFLMAA